MRLAVGLDCLGGGVVVHFHPGSVVRLAVCVVTADLGRVMLLARRLGRRGGSRGLGALEEFIGFGEGGVPVAAVDDAPPAQHEEHCE